MGSVPPIAFAVALFTLVPMAVLAQAGGNPWNPYPASRAQSAPAPLVRPTPDYVAPAQTQPTPAAPRQQAPSQYAPPGLEQQLTTIPQRQVAPATPTPRATNQPTVPQTTYAAPQPQAFGNSAPIPNPVQGGYGNMPGGFAPQGYGYAPQGYGYAPYAPGYGGYQQGYGGYPQGYGNNGYSGYGGNGPAGPNSIPGGLGNFAPFPGNNTNGGVPGFNFSPFGFF